MKKALIVTHVSGFVPQFEMNNVRLLQSMGYEVHYASNYNNVGYGTDNKRLDGTGIIRHQVDFARSPFDFRAHKRALRQLKKVLQAEEFSILHCHTPVGAVLARIAANPYRKGGMKVIYTAHGFHFFKGAPLRYWLLFYPVERFLAGMTDVLITINDEDYERAKHFCIRKKTIVRHVPGVGIDFAYWSGKELVDGEREKMREQKRQEIQIPDDITVFLSVGELSRRKNHKAVIDVLAEINKRTESKFCYLICGQGELKQELQNRIDEAGLHDTVLLLGYRSDIRELMYAADVFIFPSLQEGMPVALMEALASGMPVIASDIRGSRELLYSSPDEMEQYDKSNIQRRMKEIYEFASE